MNCKNEFPRRNKLYLHTAAEKAIYDAIQEIEKAGADVRLTEAINLLSKAKDLVGDFVDGIEIKPVPEFPENRVEPGVKSEDLKA